MSDLAPHFKPREVTARENQFIKLASRFRPRDFENPFIKQSVMAHGLLPARLPIIGLPQEFRAFVVPAWLRNQRNQMSKL